MSRPNWSAISDARALRAANLFVAEGRLVVEQVLAQHRRGDLEVVGILAAPAAANALDLQARAPGITEILTAQAMEAVTGFNFHRGVLALVRRPVETSVGALIAAAASHAPLVIAEHIADVDNVGSIFRNARALGASAVLLDDTCADPLYRKAVRTSIGAVLDVPWAVGARREIWQAIEAAGCVTVGLTPHGDALPLSTALASISSEAVTALVVGTEGAGLDATTLTACDVRARIPMSAGADSLNVATALALGLYAFRADRDIR